MTFASTLQVLRTHKKKAIAGVVVVLLLFVGVRKLTAPKQPQYITAVAARSVLQQEANVSLSGEVTTALSTTTENLTTAENALATIDDVLNRTDVGDALDKSNTSAADSIRAQQHTAHTAMIAARASVSAAGDY